MPIVLGVDPGLDGALVFLDTERRLLAGVYDMPTELIGPKHKKRGIDVKRLDELLRLHPILCAGIEAVGTRPGQGGVGNFTFGQTVGIVRGALGVLRVPVVQVEPQKWQQQLGIHRHTGIKDTKAASRARASQLFPESRHLFKHKGSHGLSDAALIAVYVAMFPPTEIANG